MSDDKHKEQILPTHVSLHRQGLILFAYMHLAPFIEHDLIIFYFSFTDNSSILDGLFPKYKAKVLEKISTDLPLKITANLVSDEGYWKRCCKARWEICDISAYGDSWKRMYFERNLQDIIEHFVPETTDPTNLNEALPLSANFVKKLEVGQLLPPVREAPKGPDFDDASDAGSDAGDEPECDHFNFAPVLKQLPNLEELHVTYGVKDCGMNFEWNLFQFTARDCLQLAQCITACKHLKVFRLHRSKVDDDKVRVLISHILDHPGLTELDLSHNIIGDRGARAVGKFINNHSHLVKLNLCDNQIRSTGAQAIAHALTKNTTLLSLNLRLNRLGDEGGQAICRALLKNSTLRFVRFALALSKFASIFVLALSKFASIFAQALSKFASIFALALSKFASISALALSKFASIFALALSKFASIS